MYLVDFSNLVFRNFHSLKELKTGSGMGTGAVYGTLNSLFYLMAKYKFKTNQAILVLDKKPSWKFDLYPEYKSSRKREELPKLMSVPFQLKLTRFITSLLGFTFAYSDGEECDDVIYTLAKVFNKMDREVFIFSADHDMIQCLEGSVKIMRPTDQGEEIIDEDSVVERSEIIPSDYWKVQTMAGCSTDKVPGLPGVGESTAQKIVNANSWERIINNDDKLQFPDGRSKTMFRKGFDKWNYKRDEQLVRLRSVKTKLIKNKFDKEKLREWLLKLELKSYLEPTAFQRTVELFEVAK